MNKLLCVYYIPCKVIFWAYLGHLLALTRCEISKITIDTNSTYD